MSRAVTEDCLTHGGSVAGAGSRGRRDGDVSIMWDPGSGVGVNMSQPHPLITSNPHTATVTRYTECQEKEKVTVFDSKFNYSNN